MFFLTSEWPGGLSVCSSPWSSTTGGPVAVNACHQQPAGIDGHQYVTMTGFVSPSEAELALSSEYSKHTANYTWIDNMWQGPYQKT